MKHFSSRALNILIAMKERSVLEPRLLRLAKATLLIAILLTPSIWMLKVVPPLWKDVDAYNQVTKPPGAGAILHYAPLYCFVARIPFYVGQAIESFRGATTFPRGSFFIHPILSDSGVFVLLLSQHLALCAAAFHLICAASRLFLARIVLATAWAINPLFYTFAQCVGTEALSMILMLLLSAAGLRMIRNSRKVPRKDWFLLGTLLWLCILTRHINAMLAILLPLAFFLLSAHRLVMIPVTCSRLHRRWRCLQVKRDLRNTALALAVGVSSVVLAHATLRTLSYAVHIPYHSSVGFTFLWRLKFLATLPAETRNQLLDKVAKNTPSPDVRKLISVLRESPPEDQPWDVLAFMHKAQVALFTPETEAQEKRFNLVLNHTARAFLYPPDEIFLRAVGTDFVKYQKTRIPDVVNHLFGSTTFYFSHPETMADCASLSTFREKSATDILAVFKKHSYFRHARRFDYTGFLIFWFANLSLLAVLAKIRKEDIAAVFSYATALTLVGLLMMLANCVLTELQPRFTLPMWELTIVSASVLFGRTVDCLSK